MSLITRVKSLFGYGGINPTMEGGIPVNWPVNYWQKNYRPMGTDGNATVAGCVDAYAQAMSSLPPKHLRINDRGGKDWLQNSAFTRVMRKPNGYQSRSDFTLNFICNLLYKGNAYAFATRNDRNEINALHIMPSDNTMPYIDPESKAIFYGFGSNPLVGETQLMAPQRDVLHVRLHCPRHPLVGVTPIENCALSIASNTALLAHQATFFNNMSRPSGIISTDQILKKDQLDQLRQAWAAQSQGMNSGEVPILGGGMKFQSLSLSSEDAQLVDAYHMSVEDIARAFRIPLPLIGDLKNASYNNVEQLIASWLSTGLGFLLEHVEEAYGLFFGIANNECIQHDTKLLLRTDFKGRVDALTKGISGGLYSVNEARAEEGLASVDYGDEPRLQAQVIPLSSIAIPDSGEVPDVDPAPIADDEDDEDEIDALDDETRQFILERKLQKYWDKHREPLKDAV